jgi:hypothetical protein
MVGHASLFSEMLSLMDRHQSGEKRIRLCRSNVER